jgi:hypothetical protein
MGSDGLGDEVQDATVLLAAGFNGGKHRFHESATAPALRAEGLLESVSWVMCSVEGVIISMNVLF